MKFVYSEKFGTVYSKEANGDVMFYPMSKDGSFNTDEGGMVENWDEMEVGEKLRVLNALD